MKDLEKGITKSFAKVKEELDEHLDSINQNTAELTAAYQTIAQLEAKVEKLSERIDELSLESSSYESLPSINLTLREQEVFLTLYTSSDPLCIEEITKYLGLTADLVLTYIDSLMAKGVPLLKKSVNELTFFALESQFKDLQARKGVVSVSETVAAQFS